MALCRVKCTELSKTHNLGIRSPCMEEEDFQEPSLSHITKALGHHVWSSGAPLVPY